MSSPSTQATFLAGVASSVLSFEVDLETCRLHKRTAVALEGNVQTAWASPSGEFLVVGTSSRVNREEAGSDHFLFTVGIDRNGDMVRVGDAQRLPHRPVSMAGDASGSHLVVAYAKPAGLAVLRLGPDGKIGAEVAQPDGTDVGLHPHQVRVTPDGAYAVVVARGTPPSKGWWANKGPQVEGGSLAVLHYADGVMRPKCMVRVGDGTAFGPRHLDFHPTGPWVYVAVETQNEVAVFRRGEDSSLTLLQRLSTLVDPETVVHQGVGTIQVHPSGQVVYVANRSYRPVPQRNGTDVMLEDIHENSLVVLRVDQETGELVEIQRIDSGGICPRNFGLDPTGSVLAVAHESSYWVKDAMGGVRRRPAGLSTFRVHPDGRLEAGYRLDEPVPGGKIRWAGWAGPWN
ncbi:putative 3-carboxymuconate cyclase-like protein [metagenome]|uniref:Putative 3-carboxymuconate cyclase-like protein n=1 Tax=metagenome TaxID=256318 RepID=A0A2P2C8Y8_9ZZZZ